MSSAEKDIHLLLKELKNEVVVSANKLLLLGKDGRKKHIAVIVEEVLEQLITRRIHNNLCWTPALVHDALLGFK